MTQTAPQPIRLPRVAYPRIGVRVTGPFLLAIVVIAALGSFIVTRLVAGSIQERFNNQLTASASAASNIIVEIERQQLETLRAVVFTEGMSEAIAASDSARLDTLLRPIAVNAGVDDLIVFSPTGNAVLQLSRVASPEGINYALPATAPDLSSFTSIQNILIGETDNLGDKYVEIIGDPPNGVVYLSAPIISGDGQLAGGATLGLTLAHLAQLIGDQALSRIILIDPQGQVIGSNFRSSLFPTLTLLPEDAASLMEAVQAGSPVRDLPPIDGVPYQALYSPFQLRSRTFGLLSAALPSNFIVEQSSTSRDAFSVLFSLTFAGVAVLGLLVARSITRPVARLVDTTRAIREGDLSRRVNLETPDELGELGVSFNHMADQLIARNEEINQLYLEQLQEAARREAILVSIGDAVVVLDPESKPILRNHAAEELTERAARHPQTKRALASIYRDYAQFTDARIVHLGDNAYSIQATPVRVPSGELLGYVIVFRDITALVEAERAKDEMILQLSHELRTPLSATRGYVDLVKMLESQRLSEQGDGFLNNATVGLATLERMLNQVIDVSAIMADQFNIYMQRFNLAELLEARAATWQPIAAERGLTLSFTVSPGTNGWIEGDETRLGEVIDHLLRNACSYTLPDGWVGLQLEERYQDAIIKVIDSGVGIDRDEIDHVFERLYRGRSADAGATDARGLGLGLYLSRQIVERHNGSITLESQINVGTIVTVKLPITQES